MATLLAACGGLPVREDIGKRTWHELRSAHFVLWTDLDRDRADARIRELERMWIALATHYRLFVPGGATPPTQIFQVLHLSSCSELRELRPGTSGFVTRTRDFQYDRLAVTCEHRSDQRRRRVLLHELAHVFNAHYVPGLPAWLNEGLAEYYETLEVVDGRVRLGTPPGNAYLQSEGLPRLDRLLAFDRSTVYARAIAELRGYLEAHPDDSAARLGIVRVELAARVPDTYLGVEGWRSSAPSKPTCSSWPASRPRQRS